MKYKVTQQPNTEPITLEEAKTFLRVPHDEEDDLIQSLISVARETVENRQFRAISDQTIKLYKDDFPGKDKPILLPRPPLKEIISLKIDGEEYEDYIADNKSEPALLYPKKEWPDKDEKPNLIEIEYKAGYESDKIPKPTIQAIYLLLSHFYEVRGAVIDGTVNEIPFTVESLINMNRTFY